MLPICPFFVFLLQSAHAFLCVFDCLSNAFSGRICRFHCGRWRINFASRLSFCRASDSYSDCYKQIFIHVRNSSFHGAFYQTKIPSVFFGFLGSAIGARLSLLVSEKALKYMLLGVLPVAAFCVLNKKIFKAGESKELKCDLKTFLIVMISALIIGTYDGLYGPGTGTFLIIAFTVFAKMRIEQANAHTKVINFSTNVAALVVFLLHGQVLIPLGIAAALSNMLGNYFGSGLVMTKGPKIVKPLIIFVLTLLLVKIIFGF